MNGYHEAQGTKTMTSSLPFSSDVVFAFVIKSQNPHLVRREHRTGDARSHVMHAALVRPRIGTTQL